MENQIKSSQGQCFPLYFVILLNASYIYPAQFLDLVAFHYLSSSIVENSMNVYCSACITQTQYQVDNGSQVFSISTYAARHCWVLPLRTLTIRGGVLHVAFGYSLECSGYENISIEKTPN